MTTSDTSDKALNTHRSALSLGGLRAKSGPSVKSEPQMEHIK